MPERFFWDTAGFFSFLSSDDRHHQTVKKLLRDIVKKKIECFTTDWVVGETCTLLTYRSKPHLIRTFLTHLEQSSIIRVHHVDEELFADSKQLLLKYLDQKFSFTDCTSFATMKTLKISKAVTEDRHFLTAGFEPLL